MVFARRRPRDGKGDFYELSELQQAGSRRRVKLQALRGVLARSKVPLIALIAGISLGLVALVAFGVVLPQVVTKRKRGNEAMAIGALKTITTAQSLFREGDKEMDTNFDYGTLQELSDAQLIDSVLGSGEKQGYAFSCAPSPVTSEFLWFATANPVSPGTTGDRYYGTNQSGVIFYSEVGPLEPTSECQPRGTDVQTMGLFEAPPWAR